MCRVHGLYDATELLHEELQLAFMLLNILCHQHRNLQMIIQILVFWILGNIFHFSSCLSGKPFKCIPV